MASHTVPESLHAGQIPVWVDQATYDSLHKLSMLSPQSMTRVMRLAEVEPDFYQLQIKHDVLEKEWTALVNRFMAHIDMKSSDIGCWLWTSNLDHLQNYGYFYIGYGLNYRAHRVSWLIHYGAIPNNLFVLHKCDVRHCVNPEHLFLGTHQENMADRSRKGRVPVILVRLTVEKVLEIRRLAATGNYTQKKLSEMFGVNTRTISNIISRKAWKDV